MNALVAEVVRELVVLVTDSMAASLMEAARPRTAFEIEVSKVSDDASTSGFAFGVFTGASSAFAEEAVVSAGAELKAETATEPIPITALPNKLTAEAPVSSKRDEAVLLASSSGGGGRGSSSCLLVAMAPFLGLISPRLGFRSAALLEQGVAGDETGVEMDERLGGCGGGSFAAGANRLKQGRTVRESNFSSIEQMSC